MKIYFLEKKCPGAGSDLKYSTQIPQKKFWSTKIEAGTIAYL